MGLAEGVRRAQREAGCGGEAPALTCFQVIPSLEVLDEEESRHYNTCVASSINKETEEPEVPPRVLQGRGDLFTSSHHREGSQHEGKAKSAERGRGRWWATGTWPALLRMPVSPAARPAPHQQAAPRSHPSNNSDDGSMWRRKSPLELRSTCQTFVCFC